MENQKDPVCGMQVNPETAKFKSNLNGKTYYFCSEQCKKSFDKKPDDFITKS